MAFPIPDHLPRSQVPQDASSKILSEISKATPKTLKAQLASSWVADLDRTIKQTKDRIHERIYSELPSFDRQLETSKSVQTRLHNLTTNVDCLSNSLSNPESGLLPNLIKFLSEHAALAQRASDSNTKHHALTYLSRCNAEYLSLLSMIQGGKLPEAVKSCQSLQGMLDSSPEPLRKTELMVDLKRRFRALHDSAEEQLSDAYSRSIKISSSELVICPSVQVRQSQTIIPLSDILSSFSPSSLTAHLSSLRRDLLSHFIEFPLQQSITPTVSSLKDSHGAPAYSLSLFPAPSTAETLTFPLTYLTTLFQFLASHFFSSIPEVERISFLQSLYKPTTTALLRYLLVPAMPSNLAALPLFLDLVKEATEFERQIGLKLNGESNGHGDVKAWADNVGGHYARKRRVDLFENARALIFSHAGESDERTFRVEVSEFSEGALVPAVVPVQGEDGGEEADGWDFDDDPDGGDEQQDGKEASWGFDDQPNDNPPGPERAVQSEEKEEDPSDAWGWNDDDDEDPSLRNDTDIEATEHTEDNASETVWDDPWDERPPTPPPLSHTKPAKLAKRLEKFSSKGKSGIGVSSPGSSAPSSPANFLHTPEQALTHTAPLSSSINSTGKPLNIAVPTKAKEKETYVVSGRAKDIIKMVEDILAEGYGLTRSHLFDELNSASSSTAASSPGVYILQTAPSVLDLFRALYPITLSSNSTRLPERSMRFSNDCTFLSEEVSKLIKQPSVGVAKEQLHESAERLKMLGEWWFDSTVEKQREGMRGILTRAGGFIDTGNQDRFDECELAVSNVLREVISIGYQWKTILPLSKYYRAVGLVVEASLTKILDDILALPDIPEMESKNLSELCRMLNALESLFVESTDTPSLVVAYVPSWLKFSYLSELLEASIADISYLFDEGALVDFEVEELVSLVRALFADTQLRTNTISKLMGGHPVPR